MSSLQHILCSVCVGSKFINNSNVDFPFLSELRTEEAFS